MDVRRAGRVDSRRRQKRLLLILADEVEGERSGELKPAASGSGNSGTGYLMGRVVERINARAASACGRTRAAPASTE